MFDRRIVDEISNSKGYSIALLTTFNFEISYFERAVLNALYDKNIKNIEIFVDADELEKAVSESIDNNLNKKYIANPIRINSAFHPKVVLLLGEEKAKLIVASANIKTSGYTLNNEIYNIFEYSKDNQDNLNLINDAISFFERLNSMSYFQDEKLFNKIDDLIFRHRRSDNNDIKLIQNLDKPVLEQLKEIITGNVASIDIAVPYYDNELLGYKDLSEAFNCNNINLYLQNGLSTFPVDFNNNNNGIVSNDNIYTYLKLKSNGKKNFYHGKVFRINTDNKSYILYGSSNCTMSALSKTYHNGGNIECNILEEGQKSDFDYFFDNFEIESFDELTCNIIEYEPQEKKNYSFKYGIKKDEIKLYLSYRDKKENIEVQIGEKDLSFEYIEKDLVITLDKLTSNEINNIFDLKITDGDIQEIVRCWYFDIDTVENYRNAERATSFDDINVDEDMEKYREHMELIVRTLALTKDEYSEQIKLQRMLNKKSNLENQEDLDEDEIDDDFIIDKDIPDEYIKKNKDFTNAYIKSRLFSDRFFKGLRLKGSGSGTPSTHHDNKPSESERKKRPATPAEKRFERFIKSRVKGILREEYIELVDYDHYKNSIGVILDVINEYKYKEQVEDIFDDKYVIEISLDMINKLLEKESVEHTKEDQETTIILALISIIENHMLNNSEENKDYKVELLNKDIIKKLNQLFNIRENFEELLQYAVDNISAKVRTIDYDYYKSYIESLFDYKTKTQLLDIIRSKFDSNAEINTEDGNVHIKFSTLDIGKFFKLDPLTINEIRNYYKNQSLQLNSITVEVSNIKDDYPATANPVRLIVFNVDPSGVYTKKMQYKDGNVLEGKTERL